MRYPCSVRLLPINGRTQPVISSPYKMVIGFPWLAPTDPAGPPEAFSASLFFAAERVWNLGESREGEVEFLFWDEFPQPLQGQPFEVRDGNRVVGEGHFL